MNIFFVHSKLQWAIVSKLYALDDILIFNRNFNKVSGLDKVITYTFDNFVLSSYSDIPFLIEIIKRHRPKAIYFPHSHYLNRFFSFVRWLYPNIKINYIEDGAATWRYITSQPISYEKKFSLLSNCISFFLGNIYKFFPLKISAKFFKYFSQSSLFTFFLEDQSLIYSSIDVSDCRATFVDISDSKKRRELLNSVFSNCFSFF